MVAVILIVISFFMAGSDALPVYESMSSLKSIVAEKEALLFSRSEIANHIDNLRLELESRYGELQRLALVVPEKKSTAEIVSTLDDIAGRTGNIILAMKVEDGLNQDKPYDNLNFEVTLEGNYSAMTSFVEHLTKNLRLIDVQNIVVALASQEEVIIGSPKLSSQIKGSAYVLKPLEERLNIIGARRSGNSNEDL